MANNMRLAIACILLAIAQNLAQPKSPCSKILVIDKEKSVGNRWYGLITLSTQVNIRQVTLELEFDKSIVQLGNWLGAVTSDDDNVKFSIKNDDHEIDAGQSYNVRFFVIYETNNDLEPPRLVKVNFNGNEICSDYVHLLYYCSTGMCPAKTLYRYTTTPIPSEDTKLTSSVDFSMLNNIETCGVNKHTPSGLLIRGQHTNPGEHPWHATIYQKEGSKKMFLCNGSLISKQHVITAAHCTSRRNQTRDPQSMVIILGKYGFWIDGKNEQSFQGKEIFVHENFNWTYFFNDISIIKLDRPTEYTDFVRPICLWEEDTSLNIVVNHTGLAVGWGREDLQNLPTDLLMQIQMPVIDTLSCIFSHPEFYSVFLSPGNFCAGYTNGSSYCPFSGSGLTFPKTASTGSNIVWQLRGLASNTVPTGNKCNTKNYVIFTDVAKYLDWIGQKLKI